MAEPLVCYDKNGIPIQRGDVVKVFHFVGSRRKRHYMFKQCLGPDRYPSSPEGWSKVFFSHLNLDQDHPYHEEPGRHLQAYEIVQSTQHDHDQRPRKPEPPSVGMSASECTQTQQENKG